MTERQPIAAGCLGLLFAIAIPLPHAELRANDNPAPGAQVPDPVDNREDPPSTAEDVLRALQRRRPANEVIPPASALGKPYPAPAVKRWPEGWTLVERSGHLAQHNGWWTFFLDDPGDEPPLKLLPNTTLELMIRTAAHQPPPTRFVVSGELTDHQGENYLLVRLARRPVPAEQVSTVPSTPAEPTRPAKPVASEAPVEDVLARMQALEPGDMVAGYDEQLFPADASGTTATTGPNAIPDGTPMMARPGRLARAGSWWIFVMESDSASHPEPPLRLLPCRNTEMMVRSWEKNPIGLVFVVSGEILLFKGENYLLPRIATLRMDHGNLRK